VRRATPATLTGVSGRPTLALAVEISQSEFDSEDGPLLVWKAANMTIPVPIAIADFFNMLIGLLPF
jgi:hypothetical protein